MSDWNQIREYPDRSKVYASNEYGQDWLSFCGHDVGPDDGKAILSEGIKAYQLLKKADKSQSAFFAERDHQSSQRIAWEDAE
jgi:hypothetical protein